MTILVSDPGIKLHIHRLTIAPEKSSPHAIAPLYFCRSWRREKIIFPGIFFAADASEVSCNALINSNPYIHHETIPSVSRVAPFGFVIAIYPP